jgi:hypothetical protein
MHASPLRYPRGRLTLAPTPCPPSALSWRRGGFETEPYGSPSSHAALRDLATRRRGVETRIAPAHTTLANASQLTVSLRHTRRPRPHVPLPARRAAARLHAAPSRAAPCPAGGGTIPCRGRACILVLRGGDARIVPTVRPYLPRQVGEPPHPHPFSRRNARPDSPHAIRARLRRASSHNRRPSSTGIRPAQSSESNTLS